MSHDDVTGAGCAIEKDVAILRSVGESVERYSGIQSWSEYRNTTEQAVSCDFQEVLPRRCLKAEGFDPQLVDDLDQVDVASAIHELTGKTVHLPASYLFLGYRPDRGEKTWSYPDSNGLASGVLDFQTKWRAIAEVIERDALMLRWILNETPHRISTEEPSLAPLLNTRTVALRSLEVNYELYLLSRDVDILILGCLLIFDDYPYHVVGLGTGDTFDAAASKAIDEAISVRFALQHSSDQEHDLSKDPDGKTVRTYIDHARFYGLKENFKKLRSFFRGSEAELLNARSVSERDWMTMPLSQDQYLCRLEQIAELGFSVISRELTTIDLPKEWHVYRIVVPQALPLSQSMTCQWLATPRLMREAEEVGVDKRDFNPYPHPFA